MSRSTVVQPQGLLAICWQIFYATPEDGEWVTRIRDFS